MGSLAMAVCRRAAITQAGETIRRPVSHGRSPMMSTAASRARTLLVAAAAASMGIGIAAAPAAAVPGSPPILPPNPIRAHESAAVQLATHLADRAFPNDPVRVVTDAFSRFNTRFNG